MTTDEGRGFRINDICPECGADNSTNPRQEGKVRRCISCGMLLEGCELRPNSRRNYALVVSIVTGLFLLAGMIVWQSLGQQSPGTSVASGEPSRQVASPVVQATMSAIPSITPDSMATKVAAAKAELKATETESKAKIFVGFDAQPWEQAVREGEIVTFTLRVANRDLRTINGLSIMADGAWQYMNDIDIKPIGRLGRTLFFDTIEVDSVLKPRDQIEIAVHAVAGKFPLNSDGHTFKFSPYETGDFRSLTGVDLPKPLKVYVLPASDVAGTKAPKMTSPEETAKAEAIAKYLFEGFGTPGYKTSWYDSIGEITVSGDMAIAKTPMPPGPGSKAQATKVCSAVSGFVYDRTKAKFGLRGVQVLANDGSVLIDRQNINQPCQ